jgi:hypothetical protein
MTKCLARMTQRKICMGSDIRNTSRTTEMATIAIVLQQHAIYFLLLYIESSKMNQPHLHIKKLRSLFKNCNSGYPDLHHDTLFSTLIRALCWPITYSLEIKENDKREFLNTKGPLTLEVDLGYYNSSICGEHF